MSKLDSLVNDFYGSGAAPDGKPMTEAAAPAGAQGNQNVRAFLDLLGAAEGADYGTIVGGGQFDDFSRHPGVVGVRTAEGPSTAAGKYQITKTTYSDFAPKIGVSDFSPESQDRLALAIIEREGALGDVLAGDFDAAIKKLGNRWASLPSSPYSQPKRDQAFVDRFVSARQPEAPVRRRLEEAADTFLSTSRGTMEQAARDQESVIDRGRSLGEVVADTGLAVAGGFGGLGELIGTGVGLATGDMDNALRSGGAELRQWAQENQSKVMQAQKAMRQLAVENSEDEAGKFFAYLSETLGSPALAIDFIAEQAPQLLVMGGTGRIVGGAAKLAGVGQAGAGTAGTAAAIGTGSSMQGLDAAGQAYDQIKALPKEVRLQNPTVRKLIAQGVPEDEAIDRVARAEAMTAGAASGGASAALNLLPGASTLERALAGGVKRGGSRTMGAVKGALGEGFTEGADEAGGVLAANYATQQFDPSQPLTAGVGEAAAAGALFAPFGGVAGAVQAGQPANVPAPIPAVPSAPPDSPLQSAVAAAAAATPASAPVTAPAADPAARLAELQAITQGTPDAPGRVLTQQEADEYRALTSQQQGIVSPEWSPASDLPGLAGPDPLAPRLAPIAAVLEDRAALSALRTDPRFGKAVVTDLLTAYARAKNPTLDRLTRDRSLSDLERLLGAFSQQPTYVPGAGDLTPTTQQMLAEQEGGELTATPEGAQAEQARRAAEALARRRAEAMANQRRAAAEYSTAFDDANDEIAQATGVEQQDDILELNRLMAEEQADLAERRGNAAEAARIRNEVRAARARNQVGKPAGSFGQMDEFAALFNAERADLEAQRAQAAQDQQRGRETAQQRFEAELAAADARVAESRARESQVRRQALLTDLIDAGVPAVNPVAGLATRFTTALQRAGYRDIVPTEDEMRVIQRAVDVANARGGIEPAAPNEMPADLVPARTQAGAPAPNTGKIAEVLRLLAQGWRLQGKTLVSPRGKRRILNLKELEAVRNAQKALRAGLDPAAALSGSAAQPEAQAAPGAQGVVPAAPVAPATQEGGVTSDVPTAQQVAPEAQEAGGQEGAQESRDDLLARYASAEPFSDEEAALYERLKIATRNETRAKIAAGEIPVFETGDDTFDAITPSAKQPGMFQVTRYSRNGVIGDAQYASVDDALDDEFFHQKRLIPQAEAEQRFAEAVQAEAQYQARILANQTQAPTAPEQSRPAPGQRSEPAQPNTANPAPALASADVTLTNEGKTPTIVTPLDAAAHEAATSPLNDLPQPTDEQKKAGNYVKGAVRLHGMDISIENPQGSVRSGVAPDGTAWQNTLAHHYGYIKGSIGADQDQIDVFLTSDAETATVAWVIDQKNPDGSFDEHKAVIGPKTEEEARAAYLANYDAGWDGIGAITSMPMEAFRAWALDGKRKRKALVYVEADATNVDPSAPVNEDGNWLAWLFGAQPAAPEAPAAKIDLPALSVRLRQFANEKLAEADDWASRQYKKNDKQIKLYGDGPRRNPSMSVSEANESRRRRAIEDLQQQAQAASNLADRIDSGQDIQPKIEMAIRAADSDIARDGRVTRGKTRDDQIASYISGSMLGDQYGSFGDRSLSHEIYQAYKRAQTGAPAGTNAAEAAPTQGEVADTKTDIQPSIPEPKNWRTNYGAARKYAEDLGVGLRDEDGKYLKLPALTAAIEAAQAGAARPADAAPTQGGTSAERTEYPFGEVPTNQESKFFRSRVRVLPEMRGDTAWEGEVYNILNGGRLVEVKRDEQDFTVRVRGERIEVLERVQNGIKEGKVNDGASVNDRWRSIVAATSEDSLAQQSIQALARFAGATGEPVIDVWSRWRDFIGAIELAGRTGEQVVRWMEGNLISMPWADRAIPGNDVNGSMGSTPDYWRSKLSDYERAMTAFNKADARMDQQTFDVERVNGDTEKIKAARDILSGMRNKAAENGDYIRKKLEEAEKNEAKEAARAEEDSLARFKPFDASLASKKPSAASITGWFAGTWGNGANTAWSDGSIADLYGEPHLKGWDTRKSSKRTTPDVDRVIPRNSNDQLEPVGMYDGKVGQTKGVMYYQMGDNVLPFALHYVQYFMSKYKGAKLVGNLNMPTGPATVVHEGRTVGVVMPMRVNQVTAEELRENIARGESIRREREAEQTQAPEQPAQQVANPDATDYVQKDGESAAADAPADTPTTNQPALTGPRRNPTQVSAFAPYNAGDIVTIGGQDWQVQQDMGGWYLTSTGNWRGTHPTIQKIRGMNELIAEVEQAATAQPDAAEQTDAPARYASAIDALNADDHEAAALIVQKMKGDELVELGRLIGFYRQNLESVKAYKDRLTSVLPKLTTTVREATNRKRALQDKLLDRAMEYDRAANHAEAARKNGVAEDSTAFISFYRPMDGGETVEMRIPEKLDLLAADVQSLRSDPDFAEIGPMVENARPRVFNHKTSNQPAYRLTFDQWLEQQWAGNRYRDTYLENAGGDEQKARYAAASGGGESEVSARNAYWSALMNAPRDADVSLEMYDSLTDAQKRDASRHFFRLDDLVRDRYQREAMQKKAEEDRVAREVIAPMQAEVDRLRSMNERTKSGTDAWNKRATDAASLEGLIADLRAGRITVQELPAKWRGEGDQAAAEETGKTAAQDAPYLRLLNLKSTALLSESGGRKLYAVTPTGAFRDEFFQFGRGWTLPPSNAFEFVEKGRVTGNASDNGYILIDKRGQDRGTGVVPTADANQNALDQVPGAATPGVQTNDVATTPEDQQQDGAQTPAEGVIPNQIGERLVGGRKDRAALQAMTADLTDEQIASMPLSKIWPADEIDKIEDVFVAAFSHAARAEIPAKPRSTYKIPLWVKKVKMFRQIVSDLLFRVDREQMMQKLREAGGSLEGFASKVALLEAIDRKQWGRIGKVGEYPDATRYDGSGNSQPAPFVNVEIDGSNVLFGNSGSVADVVERVIARLGGESGDKKMAFEVRGSNGRYFINKKGDKEYRSLKTFTSAKEALAYRDSNYDELVAAWEAVKDRDNVRKSDVRRDENRDRTGKDWRSGRDATGDDFLSTFGFRGVEFGNWVNQGEGARERQGMLNQAYDALMDLADVLGIPPKAVSLNGSMGLAFGSRGSGTASAHFEPGNLVINLTKTRGAGKLAHEWFHALDNYFARQRGGEVSMQGGEDAQMVYRRNNYITYRPEAYYMKGATTIPAKDFEAAVAAGPVRTFSSSPDKDRRALYLTWRMIGDSTDGWVKRDGVRPEVEGRFAELVEALESSPMTQRSARNDKSATDGYWSRIIERGARAFENYVILKMRQQGYQNDYLANVRTPEEFPRSADRYPYLLDDEAAPIEEAFDNLFGTIQTRETEQGVAMFSFAAPAAPQSLAEVESSWDSQGIENALSEKDGIITLHKIIVPDGKREAGVGTKAMQELFAYADATGQQVALTPSGDFGGNKRRLESFYRGLGFRTYKGFAVREKLIRDPASPEVRYSFAGERAATADKMALGAAQARLAAGEDAETVRQETGWFRGADGKWRFEVSDGDAKLKNLRMEDGEANRATVLSEILDHPALFAAYPALRNMDVQIGIGPDRKNRGSFSEGWQGDKDYFGSPPEIIVSATTEARALSTLLHEIQHGIQTVEGFATGGSIAAERSKQSSPENRRKMETLVEIDDLARENNVSPIRFAELSDYPEQVRSIVREHVQNGTWDRNIRYFRRELLQPAGRYQKLAGEVEARNVQARQRMTAAERRATPPSQTADVADADVIVVFNGKEMASAPVPANALSAPTSVSRPAASTLIADFLATRPGAPGITLVDRFADLPDQVQRDALDQGGSATTTKGAVFEGRVYLVRENHDSITDLEATLYHETVGHVGLRAMLGDGFTQKLNQLYLALGGQTGLVGIMTRRGMGQKAQQYVRGIQRAMAADAAKKASDPAYRRRWTEAVANGVLTEEVFAHIAQQQGARPGLMDRFKALIGAVRDWLRRHKLMNLASLGETDLLYMLDKARRGLNGPGGPQGGRVPATARIDEMAGLSKENLLAVPVQSGADAEASGRSGWVRQGGTRTVLQNAVPATARIDGKAMPATIEVDGVTRPTTNSEGRPIHPTEEGVRNFWRWFGESKVVDAEGRPLVVYHGTDADFAAFDPDKIGSATDDGHLGRGFYFSTDPRTIGRRTIGMPVYLRAENPLVVSLPDFKTNKKTLVPRDLGDHDAVILDYSPAGYSHQEIMVRSPEQIKSAVGNNGDFDPQSPVTVFSIDGAASMPRDERQAYLAEAAGRGPGVIRQGITDIIAAFRSPSAKVFGPLHKSISTSLHKASISPQFAEVFQIADRYERDISRFSAEPAAKAPKLIPSFDKLSDTVNRIIHGDKVGRMAPQVADAIFAGTLAGDSPTNGRVWTDAELRDRFGMNDELINLYREARAALDLSLDISGAGIAWQMVKRYIPDFKEAVRTAPVDAARTIELAMLELEAQTQDAANQVLRRMQADEAAADALRPEHARLIRAADDISKARAAAQAVAQKVAALKAGGYAPLMRFGKYNVDVTQQNEDGTEERIAFVKFETEMEAKTAEQRLRRQYPDATIARSVSSEEAWKVFQGVDPDTVALFAEHIGELEGLDVKDEVLQAWYRDAVNNRSAFKRMIHRKGTEGFDRDLTRVLASFVTSNARMAARQFNMPDMERRIAELKRTKAPGDVVDEAERLRSYIENPEEPFKGLKGWMFAWFLGGSLSSALLNATQPLMMTFPYLSQFGAGKAAAALAAAVKGGATGKVTDPELQAALLRAAEDGKVDAQQVHHLFHEGMRPLISKLPFGQNARARAQGVMTAWGYLFGAVENMNRRMSFIAAYNMAKADPKLGDAYEFAIRAVDETQGIYTKSNRPNWARGVGPFGAVGVAAFTFKQYSIGYVEMMLRMAKAGPAGKRAVLLQLGILVMLAGLQGIPGAEDLEDLVDTVAQYMGYTGNSRLELHRYLKRVVGEEVGNIINVGADEIANIIQHGLLSAPMLRGDLSSRVGMGDLFPATAIFKPSTQSRAAEVADIFGPPASMSESVMNALLAFDAGGGALGVTKALLPVALSNAWKGANMAIDGQYNDARGRKVVETDMLDAGLKFFGIQPSAVNAEQRPARLIQLSAQRLRQVKGNIHALRAQAIVEKDPEKRRRADEMLRDWNERNPDARLSVSAPAVLRRVKEMNAERRARLMKSLPKEMRQSAAEEFEQ